jgi:hypothetical protein
MVVVTGHMVAVTGGGGGRHNIQTQLSSVTGGTGMGCTPQEFMHPVTAGNSARTGQARPDSSSSLGLCPAMRDRLEGLVAFDLVADAEAAAAAADVGSAAAAGVAGVIVAASVAAADAAGAAVGAWDALA